jgi:hypothetical protein
VNGPQIGHIWQCSRQLCVCCHLPSLGYAELNGVFPLPGPRARAFLQLFPFIGNFCLCHCIRFK